jgi:hypothetical protein
MLPIRLMVRNIYNQKSKKAISNLSQINISENFQKIIIKPQ